MSTKQRELYIGIDLGTTNTRAHWGREGANNTLVPYKIEMELVNEEGGEKTENVLPSFVYFPYNEPYIVGPRARKMMESQPSRVIRSIKTQMGKSWKKSMKDTCGKSSLELTPPIVSSYILKTVMTGIKRQHQLEVKKVVITTPASFDTDQREATIEAARMAGFDPILLDEPRACLHDFVNRYRSGEITESVVDLTKALPPNLLQM